jgi:DNA topoisomerase-1
MTSTLQQEASRKFGMGARQTMNAAQRLYEAGHITYMRTDGIDMAPEGGAAARDAIKDRYGAELRPRQPAHVQEQGQERAGSARVHPPHRHDPRRRQR